MTPGDVPGVSIVLGATLMFGVPFDGTALGATEVDGSTDGLMQGLGCVPVGPGVGVGVGPGSVPPPMSWSNI